MFSRRAGWQKEVSPPESNLRPTSLPPKPVLVDHSREVDGQIWVRVRFPGGQWEMLPIEEYLDRLGKMINPILSATHASTT